MLLLLSLLLLLLQSFRLFLLQLLLLLRYLALLPGDRLLQMPLLVQQLLHLLFGLVHLAPVSPSAKVGAQRRVWQG